MYISTYRHYEQRHYVKCTEIHDVQNFRIEKFAMHYADLFTIPITVNIGNGSAEYKFGRWINGRRKPHTNYDKLWKDVKNLFKSLRYQWKLFHAGSLASLLSLSISLSLALSQLLSVHHLNEYMSKVGGYRFIYKQQNNNWFHTHTTTSSCATVYNPDESITLIDLLTFSALSLLTDVKFVRFRLLRHTWASMKMQTKPETPFHSPPEMIY